MNVRRSFIFIILAVLLAMLILPSAVSADTVQKRKLVYVVMDDSLSMKNQSRWPQAQYAMEVLCGLLNPQDRLELYYLNHQNPSHWSVDLSAAGINKSMNGVVSTVKTLGDTTPFKSVNNAYQALLNESRTNNFDQHWLVVLTDGEFLDADETKVRNTFVEYADTPLGVNDAERLRIIFCTIGSGVKRIDTKRDVSEMLKERGIYCYASGDNQIIQTMGEIADLISGRSRFTGSTKLKQVDSKTIQVSSDIPLFNFVVLVQGSEANLQSVSYANGKPLSISRRAGIVKPQNARAGDRLSGSVCTVDAGSDRISSGTYTLYFDRNVSTGDIIVLFEPALDVHITRKLNGSVLPDDADEGSRVHVGQEYSVSAEIFEAGTTTRIVLNALPRGTAVTVDVRNGSSAAHSDGVGQPATIQSVSDSEVRVEAALLIPGFNPITRTIRFSPLKDPVFRIASTDQDGKPLTGDQKLTVRAEEIRSPKKEKYIDFHVSLDGQPVAGLGDLLKSGKLILDTDIPYDTDPDIEPGVLRFYPRYRDGMDISHPFDLTLWNGDRSVLLGNAEISVLPSEFSVAVTPASQAVTEIRFKNGKETRDFVFTLLADGNKVNADDYDNLTFTSTDDRLSLSAKKENGSWKVAAAWKDGVTAGKTYEIAAHFRGSVLEKKAILTVSDSAFGISVDQKEQSIREAELRQGGGRTFVFALAADQTDVSADEFEPPDFVSTDGKLLLTPAKSQGRWNVTVSGNGDVPPGKHEIRATFRGQTAAAILTVEKSSFSVKPENISVSEAEFRKAGSKTLTFTLMADGTEVDASRFEELTFSAPGLSITPARSGSKWAVTAHWQDDLKAGAYQITASFRKAALNDKATLTVTETDCRIEVDPLSGTEAKQSELSKGIGFRVSLWEGGEQVSASSLQVDPGDWDPADCTFGPDPADAGGKTFLLTLTGDLKTKPDDYILTLFYTYRGRPVTKAVALKVALSEYSIRLTGPSGLVFHTPSDFTENRQAFRFDIRVDDRALTDDEMNAMTGIGISPDLPFASFPIADSGYTVTPRVEENWSPAASHIDYTITCTAPGKTETAAFAYHYIHYEVTCIENDGTGIRVDDLLTNTTGLRFRIRGDGADLTREEVEEGNPVIELNAPFSGKVLLKTQVEDDGTVTVIPFRDDKPFFYCYVRPWVPSGEMIVTLRFKDSAGAGTMGMTASSWIMAAALYLITAAIIVILFMYILKWTRGYRFSREYMISAIQANESRNGSTITSTSRWSHVTKVNSSRWLPSFREKRIVNGIKFRATAHNRNSSAAAVEFYVPDDKSFRAINHTLNTKTNGVNTGADNNYLQRGWNELRIDEAAVRKDSGTRVIIFKYEHI